MEAGHERPAPAEAMGSFDRRHRYRANRDAKTEANARVSERKSKVALLLGGGAPNMALMAGTVLAFHERGVAFDVVSTSGAGAVVALLWLAPKPLEPPESLRNIVNLSVSDPIYQGFPVNYKVFNKPGSVAEFYRHWLSLLPGTTALLGQWAQSALERLFSDWVQLAS
jgi:NTE family protein